MSSSPFISSDMRRRLLYENRQIDHRVVPAGVPNWQFPGWGRQEIVRISDVADPPEQLVKRHQLGEMMATAICGNDITSSCLYTVGITAAVSGVFAPISLLLVAIMLYLFRSVYSEVVLALPSNGGVYNCLLNTTSKLLASLAACLSILSYVATGTVSAVSASQYLSAVFPSINVAMVAQALLAVFAFISVSGIKESGSVAQVIFVVHLSMLFLLIIGSIVFILFFGQNMFIYNWKSFEINFGLLLLGFSRASLGISGFETSANFIEDQQEGVFPKTLKNMWAACTIINPTISLLSLMILPIEDIQISQAFILSRMARVIGGHSHGRLFEALIGIDAFIVLSGSVLTAYVGVIGLVSRMSFDRCLPEFFLHQNQWRGTSHWIILSFCAVCSSMHWFLRGREEILAGVYSISFLSVMALFAVGDALIKFKRNSIHRPIRASWLTIFTALSMVLIALYTTVVTNIDMFRWFLFYFTFTIAFVVFMFYRLLLLRIALYFSSIVLDSFPRIRLYLHDALTDVIQQISSQSVLFYAPNSHLPVINKAILYIRQNEQASWIRIAYVCNSEQDVPPDFVSNVALLDSIYPKIRIDSVFIVGSMTQQMCDAVARQLHVPVNMQFICCPEEGMRHLPSVRIITRYIQTEEKEAESRRSMSPLSLNPNAESGEFVHSAQDP